jgi:hypothetical protein
MQTYPSWAAQVSSEEGGQWLTHLEAGLEVDGASPEDPVGVDLFLPDEIGTQEIASQVQPLLSTTAGSQGVRAQQLDWSQAQVVILEADQEEATALVVVPEVDSTAGQALLPGGIDFDLDGAVHTAVKVQRVSAGSGARGRWQLTPTPLAELPVIKPVPKPIITAPRLPAPKPAPPSQPPTPAPPVQLGTAIKPVFDYCPYQYYGKVTTLQRALCQDSWGQWYQKQWANGTVFQTPLEIYSSALRKGAGGVAYLHDNRQNTNLLVEGFEALNVERSRAMLKYAATISQPAVNQIAQQTLNGFYTAVDSTLVKSWLSVLVQAYREGRFDAEYESLLMQGFAEYQNVMQQYLETAFPGPFDMRQTVLDMIKWLASFPSSLMTTDASGILTSQAAFNTTGRLPIDPGILAVAALVVGKCQNIDVEGPVSLPTPLGIFAALFSKYLVDAVTDTATAWGVDIASQLFLAASVIVNDVFVTIGTGQICTFFRDSRLSRVLETIAKAIEAGDAQGAAGFISELLVAANAIRFGSWHFSGLELPILQGTPLATDIDVVLFNPNLDGKSVLAFVQVKNTKDPLSRAPAITDWINKSLTVLNALCAAPDTCFFLNGPFRVEADMSMLVLVFHGEQQNNLTMMELAQLLRQGIVANIRQTPIIMVWEDASGQVWYICVDGCKNASQNQMTQTACALLGHLPDCGAQNAELIPSTSVSGSATGNTTFTPLPPPTCGTLTSVTQLCAQGMADDHSSIVTRLGETG